MNFHTKWLVAALLAGALMAVLVIGSERKRAVQARAFAVACTEAGGKTVRYMQHLECIIQHGGKK